MPLITVGLFVDGTDYNSDVLDMGTGSNGNKSIITPSLVTTSLASLVSTTDVYGGPQFNLSTTSSSESASKTLSLQTAEITLDIMFLIVAVASNTCVIRLVSLSWRRWRYHNIPNLLVLSLAVTDLVMALLGYPARLIPYVLHREDHAKAINILCGYCHFVFSTLLGYSQCIVVLMGIERFLSIRKPFFYDKYCTRTMFIWSLLGLLLYSIGVVILQITLDYNGVSESYDSGWQLYCFSTEFYRGNRSHSQIILSAIEITQVMVLVVIMLTCNICVMKTLGVMERRAAVTCPRNKQEYLRQKDVISGIHREFSNLMLAISVCFVICVVPWQVRFSLLYAI